MRLKNLPTEPKGDPFFGVGPRLAGVLLRCKIAIYVLGKTAYRCL